MSEDIIFDDSPPKLMKPDPAARSPFSAPRDESNMTPVSPAAQVLEDIASRDDDAASIFIPLLNIKARAQSIFSKVMYSRATNTDLEGVGSVLQMQEKVAALEQSVSDAEHQIFDLKREKDAWTINENLLRGRLRSRIRAIAVLRGSLWQDLIQMQAQLELLGAKKSCRLSPDFTYLDAFKLLEDEDAEGDDGYHRLEEILRLEFAQEKARMRDTYEDKISSLMAQLKHMQEQVEAANRLQMEISANIAKLEEHARQKVLHQIEEVAMEAERRVEEVRAACDKQLDVKDGEISEQRLRIREVEIELSDAQALLRAQEGNVEKAASERIRSVQDDLNRTRGDLNDRIAELERLKGQIQTLTRDKSDLSLQLNNATNGWKVVGEKADRLEVLSKQQAEELDALRAHVKAADQEKATSLKAMAEELQQAKDETQRLNELLQSRDGALGAADAVNDETVAWYKEENAALTEELSKTNSHATRVSQELEQVKQKLAEAMAQHESTKHELSAREASQEAMKARVETEGSRTQQLAKRCRGCVRVATPIIESEVPNMLFMLDQLANSPEGLPSLAFEFVDNLRKSVFLIDQRTSHAIKLLASESDTTGEYTLPVVSTTRPLAAVIQFEYGAVEPNELAWIERLEERLAEEAEAKLQQGRSASTAEGHSPTEMGSMELSTTGPGIGLSAAALNKLEQTTPMNPDITPNRKVASISGRKSVRSMKSVKPGNKKGDGRQVVSPAPVVSRPDVPMAVQTLLSWVNDGKVELTEEFFFGPTNGLGGRRVSDATLALQNSLARLAETLKSEDGEPAVPPPLTDDKYTQTDEDDYLPEEPVVSALPAPAVEERRSPHPKSKKADLSGLGPLPKMTVELQNAIKRFTALSPLEKAKFLAVMEPTLRELMGESMGEELLGFLRRPPDTFSVDSVAIAMGYVQRGVTRLCESAVSDALTFQRARIGGTNAPGAMSAADLIRKWFGAGAMPPPSGSGVEPFSEHWNGSDRTVASVYTGTTASPSTEAARMLDSMEMRVFALLEGVARERARLGTQNAAQGDKNAPSQEAVQSRLYVERLRQIMQETRVGSAASPPPSEDESREAAGQLRRAVLRSAPLVNPIPNADLGSSSSVELLEHWADKIMKKPRALQLSPPVPQTSIHVQDMSGESTEMLPAPDASGGIPATLQELRSPTRSVNVSQPKEVVSFTAESPSVVAGCAQLWPRPSSSASSRGATSKSLPAVPVFVTTRPNSALSSQSGALKCHVVARPARQGSALAKRHGPRPGSSRPPQQEPQEHAALPATQPSLLDQSRVCPPHREVIDCTNVLGMTSSQCAVPLPWALAASSPTNVEDGFTLTTGKSSQPPPIVPISLRKPWERKFL